MIATWIALLVACTEPEPVDPLIRLPAREIVAQAPVGDPVDADEAREPVGELARRPPAFGLAPLPIDRTWEILDPHPDRRVMLRQAGERMGDWGVEVAGVLIDGAWLRAVAETPDDEPLLRAVRERSGRAIDLEDFLLFLDDVLVAGEAGRRGEPFVVPSGRGRAAGILLHPDDVFRRRGKKPRVYAAKDDELPVDEQPPRATFPPAVDGDPPGPGWAMRYPNPTTRDELYAALDEARPGNSFRARIADLLGQLEAQGAETYLASTLRRRERGYLMWGAFLLSRARDADEVDDAIAKLEDRNRRWKLDLPITWRHPGGWEATVEAARAMAEAYDVVYATEGGARSSDHYDGEAVDFVAIALPRVLVLHAPDGATATFDLSDPQESRDLSLSPRVIDWVEAHFGMRKLDSDYPHWDDEL